MHIVAYRRHSAALPTSDVPALKTTADTAPLGAILDRDKNKMTLRNYGDKSGPLPAAPMRGLRMKTSCVDLVGLRAEMLHHLIVQCQCDFGPCHWPHDRTMRSPPAAHRRVQPICGRM